jgi:hypothetical protein
MANQACDGMQHVMVYFKQQRSSIKLTHKQET